MSLLSLLRPKKAIAKPTSGMAETHRSLAYHFLTDGWRYDPWDCRDPEALTLAEAVTVHRTHGPGKCLTADCRIFRTARKLLAAQIDQKTQPLEKVDFPTERFAPFQG